MHAPLKRQYSTGTAPSHRKRTLQHPQLRETVAKEQDVDPTKTIGSEEGKITSHASKLQSAALALCDMDIEVVLSCLKRFDHLSVLLGVPDSDIRECLASAKFASKLAHADGSNIMTHTLVVNQSQQMSHLGTGLGFHEQQVEHGFGEYSDQIGIVISQQTNQNNGQYPLLPPFTSQKSVGLAFAGVEAHAQDLPNWPWTPSFPPNSNAGQIPYPLYSSSPAMAPNIPFARSDLEITTMIPPGFQLEYGDSTTLDPVPQVDFGSPPYPSSSSHSILGNYDATSTKPLGGKSVWSRKSRFASKKPAIFDCVACTKSFARESDHRCHYMEAHEKSVTFSCNHCRNDFYLEKRFTEHHKRCHKDCPTRFYSDRTEGCVTRVANSKRVAHGCGLCAAPFSNLDDYLKHIEGDHTCWRSRGQHVSDDKIIHGLLQQPLVAGAWQAARDVTMMYTWERKDAERLKDCLEFARVEAGSIPGSPDTLSRTLAKMACECAVTRPRESAGQTDHKNPDICLSIQSQKV